MAGEIGGEVGDGKRGGDELSKAIHPIDTATTAIEASGFMRVVSGRIGAPDYIRETDHDTSDELYRYEDWSAETGGEFELVLYGYLQDLPAVLFAKELFSLLERAERFVGALPPVTPDDKAELTLLMAQIPALLAMVRGQTPVDWR